MEERARPADARTEPDEEGCEDVRTSGPLTAFSASDNIVKDILDN